MKSTLTNPKLRAPRIEEVRAKIQATQLVNRLTDHALDKLEKPMDSTQVAAALGLLKKCVPDLTASENKNETVVTHYVAEIPQTSEKPEQWRKQHAPVLQ